ncbi:ketopantoate reductase family protein [Rubrivivax rivuli]|uniref:2-dehydropantoate 2-reductase n=1 Tax=Rubrivivax rivuli TaxID=1862385 RepID=A0A437RAM6_9BURK|nr:2-dehydropantoate 2-reductase [Rubrivivax rivuli]RVU43850.1 2-dehydropantoate 2-reductase [Rubrivivax rivuli]
MSLPAIAPAPVCIVGAGALGSLVAARLALGGQAVCLIGRAAQVQALAAGGLELQDASGTHRVPLPASTDIATVAQAGLVLLCVKSADTKAAAHQMAPHLRPGVPLLSLQNGVANGPLLARLLQRPVLVGAAYIAAAQPAPGQVRHAGGLAITWGALPGPLGDAFDADTLAAVQQRLQAGGFELRMSEAPLAELWRKLVVNCAVNAVSALAQAPYGVMAAVPAVRELQAAVVQEAVAVAQAEGQALNAAEMQAAVAGVMQRMPAQRSSTAQDLARGRRSEIEQLNGEIVRAGARHGIHTPVNQALLALVQLQEAVNLEKA